MDYEVKPPSASSMLESLRAYGYSLNSAIADLIDNSITAKARNIWITLTWNGSESWISIRDDGEGMTETELSNAMIAGSQNPLAPRSKNDLGRFGLGLKTASLSQARSLTVTSKTDENNASVRRWDLDYIVESGTDEWRLLKSCRAGAEKKIGNLDSMDSGTVVLLENIDKVCGGTTASSPSHRDSFYHRIDSLRDHLAMTFHRYLSAPNKKLRIYINGESESNAVTPWDPFCRSHKATDPKPVVRIPFGNKEVTAQGFILPHKDMLSPDEFEEAGGAGGWNSHQGFYIYRNDRLLVGGSWLGLREGSTRWRPEEHYKLARIQIDITNDMDADWQIDVKKSIATPPHNVALGLVAYASQVRKEARQVFAHRGKYGKRNKSAAISKVWKSRQRKGVNTYILDRAHPLLKSFMTKAGPLAKEAEILFKLIEETVPVEQIWLDAAEAPEMRSSPFYGVDEEDVIKAAEQSLRLLSGNSSPPTQDLVDRICELECFVDHQELLYAHFGVST